MPVSLNLDEKKKRGRFPSAEKPFSGDGWAYFVIPTTTVITDDGLQHQAITEQLVVQKVDLNIQENVSAHHTDDYDITQKDSEYEKAGNNLKLVVRRGQQFDILVTFDRKYNIQKDQITAVFATSDNPLVSKGTQHFLDVSLGMRKRLWTASIQHSSGTTYKLTLQAGCRAVIGKWRLHLEIRLKDQEKSLMNVHEVKDPIYIIFNPWCPDDLVYVDDDDWRDEAVLNDQGRIYQGSADYFTAAPWLFGQFESFMLDCALYILDLAKLNQVARWNPAQVARAISAGVNESDDQGVLVGRWDGDYSDGLSPGEWQGSVKILKQFWETKEPVKYGQCWVFSGLVTTVSRCLGLPCRSVTNFDSAHDTDGSVTIDFHLQADTMDPIRHMNRDSVWNFHVWNEAWMARPDLPHGYGGWQAFDATPQETSEGIYQAGPCPVRALKLGDVSVSYDAPFIFSEVNADKVKWILLEDNKWKAEITKQSAIGKNISTIKPRNHQGFDKGKVDFNTTPFMDRYDAALDRLDITNEYKFPEGSAYERESVTRANMNSSAVEYDIYQQTEREDVSFTFEVPPHENSMMGVDLEIHLTIKNNSPDGRHLKGNISISPMQYTGVLDEENAKIERKELLIQPDREEKMSLKLTFAEYFKTLGTADATTFQASAYFIVQGTCQTFIESKVITLNEPKIDVEAPEAIKVGSSGDAVFSFVNPLPVALTEGKWKLEAKGLDPQELTLDKPVASKTKAEGRFTLTPKKGYENPVMLMFIFIAKEFDTLHGSQQITFVPKPPPPPPPSAEIDPVPSPAPPKDNVVPSQEEVSSQEETTTSST